MEGEAGDGRDIDYVAISEVAVAPRGAPGLEAAFAARVRLVERAKGFRGIEVLRDRRRPGRYLMISRWSSRDCFATYMRSEDHAVSHDRIVRGPDRPSAAGFSDYDSIPV